METKIFSENLERKKKIIGLIHKIYLIQQKNARQYNASTKTKSEVRGGGRKPWRQKGSGNARAGSSRSPLWEGGGVCFGPKPRLVIKKANKKEKRLAILASLYLKEKQFIIDSVFENYSEVKTKMFLQELQKLSISPENKILIILEKPNKQLWLASKNLKNIEITTGNCLNVTQLLKPNKIILSENSLQLINLTYGKSYT